MSNNCEGCSNEGSKFDNIYCNFPVFAVLEESGCNNQWRIIVLLPWFCVKDFAAWSEGDKTIGTLPNSIMSRVR